MNGAINKNHPFNCSTPTLSLPEGTEGFTIYCDTSHQGGMCSYAKR